MLEIHQNDVSPLFSPYSIRTVWILPGGHVVLCVLYPPEETARRIIATLSGTAVENFTDTVDAPTRLMMNGAVLVTISHDESNTRVEFDEHYVCLTALMTARDIVTTATKKRKKDNEPTNIEICGSIRNVLNYLTRLFDQRGPQSSAPTQNYVFLTWLWDGFEKSTGVDE